MKETSDFTRQFATPAYFFANKVLRTLLENTIKDVEAVAEINPSYSNGYLQSTFLKHIFAAHVSTQLLCCSGKSGRKYRDIFDCKDKSEIPVEFESHILQEL